MTNVKNIGAVALRLLAIWELLQALLYLSDLPFMLWMRKGDGLQIVPGETEVQIMLMMVVFVLLAAVLWFAAVPLSGWMTRGLSEPDEPASLKTEDLQIALFSAVGVYLLAISIPWLVSVAYNMLDLPEYPAQPRTEALFVSQLLAIIARIALAIWLLLGSRKLVELLRRSLGYPTKR